MTPAPRETAAARLQRILTELLWIAERDGPTWDEAAAHLGVDVEVLRADLTLASMIGADSDDYLDMPVELYTEGDRVHVTLHGFDRPLRLTPAEALVLLVAAQARVDRPGSADDSDDEPAADALTRALDKVARLLGLPESVFGELSRIDSEHLCRPLDNRRRGSIHHKKVHAGGQVALEVRFGYSGLLAELAARKAPLVHQRRDRDADSPGHIHPVALISHRGLPSSP